MDLNYCCFKIINKISDSDGSGLRACLTTQKKKKKNCLDKFVEMFGLITKHAQIYNKHGAIII